MAVTSVVGGSKPLTSDLVSMVCNSCCWFFKPQSLDLISVAVTSVVGGSKPQTLDLVTMVCNYCCGWF